MPETPPRPSGSEPPPGGPERKRLLLAAGALGAFAVLTGIVLLATGGGEDAPPAKPAPTACLDLWNDDEDALSDGRHASGFHGYSRTQVAYLSAEGEVLDDERAPGSLCSVIFASNGLDSEPEFAVRARHETSWGGFNTMVDAERLAALQAGALNGANAELQQSGELVPGVNG